MDATPTLLSDRGSEFSARSEGRSERCLSAIEQRKKPGKTYYTRLGMLLGMKPKLGLSRLQVLLIGTCCAHVAAIHLRSNT